MNGTRDHEGKRNKPDSGRHDAFSHGGNLDLNICVCVFVYVVCIYMGYKSRRRVYDQEDRVLK